MIEINNLCKKFGKNEVLSNINSSLDAPQVVGLVGNNGAGKTTLINMIMGYYVPTSGNVKIINEDPITSSNTPQKTF